MTTMSSIHRVFRFFVFSAISQWANGATVAVYHALENDLSAMVKAGATKVRGLEVGATPIQQLALDGHKVFAVRMGSGCVQTCLSAQALLAKHRCDLVISVGPVGDIKGDLKEGIWYLVEEVVAWQRGSHDQTGFRAHADARLKVPMAARSEAVRRILGGMPPLGVASGEVFIASDSFRSELAAISGCAAVDMNLFGLLTVLNSHGIHGIHLRTPSDRADSKAGTDFRRYSESYDGEGGRIAVEIIRALPRDPTSPQAHEALRGLLSDPDSSESRPHIPQSGKAKGGSGDSAGVPDPPAE